jgi:hypothetical protein
MSAAMNTALKLSIVFVIVAIIAAAYLCFGNMTFVGGAVKNDDEHMLLASGGDGIVVNELMSNNRDFCYDDRGKSSDWIELYNTTDGDISMQNYALSDNGDKLDKWPFPDVVVRAHGYLVVFLTGDIQSDPQQSIVHCSFKLDSSGDSLFLVGPMRSVADSVDIPRLKSNVSYGRAGGVWQIFDRPTPGFENSDAGFTEFTQSTTPKSLMTFWGPRSNGPAPG